MAWLAQYIIADSAAVNQTWNRTILSTDYVKYVNDTARALGNEETMEFRRSPNNKGSGTTLVTGNRWNCKMSSRIVASETVPLTLSFTEAITDSLANQVTSARTRFKNMKIAMIAMFDTDAEVDDVTGTRVI